jgi:hypothetical protein
MTRLLLLLVLPLFLLSFSADAQAQGIRRRPPPPRHLRRPGPPPPGFGPPCGTGSCDLTNMLDDVRTVTETETHSETTVTESSPTPTTTTKSITDADDLSDFPNDDSYANVEAMLEFAAEKYGVPLDLLKATAWTENKWEQWDSSGNVVVGGGVDYGLMQINIDTWQGSYDWSKIKSDVRENIRAGAEILQWSYNYAASKGYTGDKLAQAAYAVYNGGPSAVHRPWDTSSAWRQNDLNFESNYNGRAWEKNS